MKNITKSPNDNMENKTITMPLTIFILFVAFLLPTQYGCKKKVDTYPKFIVGCWDTGGNFNFSQGVNYLRFYDNGTFTYNNAGPYPYHINKDTIIGANGDTLIIDKMYRNLGHQLVMDVRGKSVNGQFNYLKKYVKRYKC